MTGIKRDEITEYIREITREIKEKLDYKETVCGGVCVRRCVCAAVCVCGGVCAVYGVRCV